MSSNNEEILQLLQQYNVVPLQTIPGIEHILGSRTQAQPKTDAVLTNAGFQWNEDKKFYFSDRRYQSVAAFPNRVYLWIQGRFGKVLNNTNDLAAWISGPASEFMQKVIKVLQIDKPMSIGTTANRPASPTLISPSEKALKTIKAGSRLPADDIIDLYKKAKEEGNEKLMDLVKTLKVQENMKKSDLKKVIKEIIKGVFKEMTATGAVSPISTPMAFSKRGASPKKEEEEEKQIDEMTATSAVTGYNIPAAFSRKGGSKSGVEGSEKLGYTLTPIGKKEMQKLGDEL